MVVSRVSAILCMAFLGAVIGPMAAVSGEIPAAVPQSLSSLPKIKAQAAIYYPEQAKRLRSQGRILLAFEIDDRGRATQIGVEKSEGTKVLVDSAVSILKAIEFEPPAVPESGSSPRYGMSVVFELTPGGKIQHFDVPKNAQISVCGSSSGR